MNWGAPTIVYETVVRLSPRIRLITQDNPGLMTGPGTNTYLIGEDPIFILDPGENTDRHFEALREAVGSASVMGIAPTHAHPDHWPLTPRLGRLFKAPTFGYKAHNGYSPQRTLEDGAVFEGKGWKLKALYTPGHISDHLSYLLAEERALFSGDHVMRWSTSVISRPDGNLNQYLESLGRLLSLEIAVIYPAHGEPVLDARARIGELIAHRHMRTSQILEELERTPSSISELVQRIYIDVDPRLHGMAQQSVLAHLDALIESGRVCLEVEASNPLLSTYRLAQGFDTVRNSLK